MTNIERVEAMAGEAYGLHDADRAALLWLLEEYRIQVVGKRRRRALLDVFYAAVIVAWVAALAVIYSLRGAH